MKTLIICIPFLTGGCTLYAIPHHTPPRRWLVTEMMTNITVTSENKPIITEETKASQEERDAMILINKLSERRHNQRSKGITGATN